MCPVGGSGFADAEEAPPLSKPSSSRKKNIRKLPVPPGGIGSMSISLREPSRFSKASSRSASARRL